MRYEERVSSCRRFLFSFFFSASLQCQSVRGMRHVFDSVRRMILPAMPINVALQATADKDSAWGIAARPRHRSRYRQIAEI